MKRFVAVVPVLVLFLAWIAPLAGQADEARKQVPWLDLPFSWIGTFENGVVAMSPGDLGWLESLILMIELPSTSTVTLQEDYKQAVRDLGPWRPVGKPVEQSFDNGWVFRFGVGVATLQGVNYTAETAVARHGNRRVRFWVLADSDDTFNRYQTVFSNAMSSAQDITLKQPAAAKPAQSGPQGQAGAKVFRPDANFGKGVSGVYVGVERELSASAGVGSGPQQGFNQSTGRYETSNTGTAPQLNTSIADYTEVDVLYPDGTYRRRLPIRGLASDPGWEKQQQPVLWGTWQKEGNRVIVRRGSYTTTYTVEKDGSLTSDRGRPWIKIPLPSGLRLEGTYARDDYREAAAPRLTLRADGTYQEHGNFLRMVCSPWHLVVPDADAMHGRWNDAQFEAAMAGSSGTYSFDNFTLMLKTSDGRVWQVNAYVPPGVSTGKPRRLVINGRALQRD